MNSIVTPNSGVQNGHLDIGQLASYLGWSPRYIERLVRVEGLPVIEDDGQVRFRLNDVLDWFEQNIQTLDTAQVSDLESHMESLLVADGTFRNPHRIDRLASRLPVQGIALDVPLRTKSDVLRTLVDLAEATGHLMDRERLLASLAERESLCSTAVPGGVAVCHPRMPMPSAIRMQFLCFLRTDMPVDFGADNGEGTSIFFLLCAPYDRAHLHGLARLARILHGGAIGILKSAASPQDVIRALAEAEAGIKPVA